MPTSYFGKIPEILDLGLSVKPQSILDIGPGFGKYGALFREFTDVWQRRFKKDDWQTRITAVEAFPEYLHEGHRFYYDEIIKGDIADVVDRLERQDLILWLDGPEHLEKDDGLVLLSKLYDLSNKAILISHPNEKDPKIALSQGDACGNEFERHRSIWYPEDFQPYNPTNGGEGAVVLLRKDSPNSQPRYSVEQANRVGVAYKKTGDLEGSVRFFQTALDQDPDYIHANNNLGDIFFQMGDFDTAMHYLGIVLKKQHDNNYALARIKKIEAAG